MSLFLLAGVFASRVLGHGYITNIVVNGVSYQGWNINTFPYMGEVPLVASWGTPNTGGGFPTDGYADSDIICHLDAVNGEGAIPVTAGDSLSLQWTVWPETHHGPVLDYLANCGTSCQTVDKTTLEFFKISEVGLIDGSTVPGYWGTDELIDNNSAWLVKIPENIAPGNYVLRHELIGLHGAHTEGGAQNYMQCINLQISGSGTAQPEGVLGTELYTSTDPGILVDIYNSVDYIIPGPGLIAGASAVAQSSSAITASATAIIPGATSA
ncbi:glycoside hydrolase [Aspergillus karnatakaensis]|uniref:lytic polysaccharide monooxygenase auxiliary activity family 9 protein n=1 Tax=Aspergillus karnatakaensis TaxID=1810916 RepID=UPI003CCD04FF